MVLNTVITIRGQREAYSNWKAGEREEAQTHTKQIHPYCFDFIIGPLHTAFPPQENRLRTHPAKCVLSPTNAKTTHTLYMGSDGVG